MTGKHIIKHSKDNWEYPCHADLQWKCGLFSIKAYVQRRRGTLQKHLEENRENLMKETDKTKTPDCNPNTFLWWNQKYITKEGKTRDFKTQSTKKVRKNFCVWQKIRTGK